MKNQVRNFVIIAHIDHGKSTLADRFLELTGTVEKRKMHEQYLDMNPLEREKGITIKMQPVRMEYQEKDGLEYILNLIDTPGHVDFSYEVSRALAAVEGAILLVDATQGIQAQTLANLHLAQKENLAIIPVINKIDLPSAEIEKTEEEIIDLLGVKKEEILRVSGKVGTGVRELLDAVIARVSGPQLLDASRPLRALVFDSVYDQYQGVVSYIRVVDGVIKKGDHLFFKASQTPVDALEIGVFRPERSEVLELSAGEIGYIATGIKESERVRVGDTVTGVGSLYTGIQPLVGYKEPAPMVFASIFPENQDEYEPLRDSLKKLKLNDAAFSFEPEDSSVALGRGFRAGFLGMLHVEIVSERLKREYNLKLIFSNPSVAFRVITQRNETIIVYAASKLPRSHEILVIEEPLATVEVVTPPQFLGSLTSLVNERAGHIVHTSTLAGERLLVRFESPLREIIIDFYDKLKSISRGFASMSYALSGYRPADLIRLDILVAGERITPFSEIIPREKSYHIARERLERLKELLPRELFQIALQAEVDGRIIARETISALKKDVTGYLYGGDRTRKMKLWKKQQKGKKRLQAIGRVEIPAEVFLKMLKK